MKRLRFVILRFINGLSRPRGHENLKRLQSKGEEITSIIIREAKAKDIPELAQLHVTTWSDTYRHVRKPPTFEIRAYQWKKAFEENDGSWFCFVAENASGKLIGFAKGVRNQLEKHKGELSKLYLLRDYQRVGLGKKLMALVLNRFMGEGITYMSCYVDPGNPSCGFFERMGGEWLIEPDGEINYSWYTWKDLSKLAETLK